MATAKVIKPVKVSAQLFYSQDMTKINKKFDEDNTKYSCTIGKLSAKACDALEELGIKIKNKDPMGSYINAKSTYPWELCDEDGDEVDMKKLGNGTKVIAVISSYEHKLSKKHGNAASVVKMVVTEFVEYDGGDGMDDDEEAL